MTQPIIWVADAPERVTYIRDVLELDAFEWRFPTGGLRTCPADAELVLVSDERALPEISGVLNEARERRIPSLHVVDGIIDWRNTFANPRYDFPGAKAPRLFRPVLADKIACLGMVQCLAIEHLGNTGKPELVGSVRLDKIRRDGSRPSDGIFRIMVTTARTPAFTDGEKARLLELLGAVRDWFLSAPGVDAVWRLPADVATALGVENTQTSFLGAEMLAALRHCDALVTTSSTTLLEGMILQLPTVLLDHTHTPLYVQAAWMISNPARAHEVLASLSSPDPHRLLFQDYTWKSNLAYGGAAARLETLIIAMVEAGRKWRREGGDLPLACRVLPWPGFGVQESTMPQSDELERLRTELAQWRRAAAMRIAWVRRLEAILVKIRRRLLRRL